MIEYILIMAIGALASVLANKGIAVFNDGFRPILPQYFNGKMKRRELAVTSFAISFGLVIGFGIPFSIGKPIILIHCILLTTDIIGVSCPDSNKGSIIAAVCGAIYAGLLLFGLGAIVDLFDKLPVNFLGSLGNVSSPVLAAFAAFPAVAVAYQQGFKKGGITGLISLLVYFIITRIGQIPMGGYTITLNAVGMAMLAGMIVMIIYAAKQEKKEDDKNTQLVAIFSEQVGRIQKNWWIFAVMGALIASATAANILIGDPISMSLAAEGDYTNAALAAAARGIGFIPLIFTTAIVTGVYSPVGCTFVFTVGLLLHGNPLLAGIVGAAVIIAEVFLIKFFAALMDKFPGVREMGEHIRTSMSEVLKIALLVGGVLAGEAMASTAGTLFVVGFYLLNKQNKKGVPDIAAGPVAAIILGLLLNVLAIFNIFVVA